jgi:hypothetical protein
MLKTILMKKLQFVSVIIVLLLFCPFIKQCDGLTKKAEESTVADSTAVVIDSVSEVKIKNEPLTEVENNQPNELKTYFTEESQNVFDLSSQVGIYFDNKKNEDIGLRGLNGIFFSILFSISLILTSVIGTIRIFKNKLLKTNWFYILNISFAILIVISNMFVWLDRFGQIKIGFYLLLLSNFYMLYLLKQKKEQIQH